MSARDAAAAIAAGWASVRPDDTVLLAPMADGGEGTLDAFEAAHPGARRIPVRVHGPGSRPVDAEWLLLPDGTGVVELAATSGLTLLPEPRGLDAHTGGYGEAIRAALEHGVERLVLAVGGSASTDGGAGMLAALGARLLDAAGDPVAPGARGLADLASADRAALLPPPPGGAFVLTDVTNPLLGGSGAAAVFGPQKGLDAAGVAIAEAGLARLAALLPEVDPAMPGAGAAGGTGFGLLAWGATLVPGAAAIADAMGLPALLDGAAAAISGEGRYDEQSASGKAPTRVRDLARAAGVPAFLVAGRISAALDGWAGGVALEELAGSPGTAMGDPARWLEAAGARLARELRRRAASASG